MRDIVAPALIDQRTQPCIILLHGDLEPSVRYVYTSVPDSFVVSPEFWSEWMHDRVPSDAKDACADMPRSSSLSAPVTQYRPEWMWRNLYPTAG